MAVDYSQLPLGKQTSYPEQYDPSVLVAVPRTAARDFWPADTALPFVGTDDWTGYELSWLDKQGKPQMSGLLLDYSADTPNIVESKSLKLYLNSFNQTRIDDSDTISNTITNDIAAIVGGTVTVTLCNTATDSRIQISPWLDYCIDELATAITEYDINPQLLHHDKKNLMQDAVRISHLLRSNCPVTGQPDWASVRICYSGYAIDDASLLQYLCSYRLHQGFHEQCIERIFCDIWTHCQPTALSVEGRFTRRGGLEINPFRSSTHDSRPTRARQWRQ